jgi:hypothetical protein
MVIFRVGGLEESGRHLGRSFVKPCAILLPDSTTETTLRFSAHGMAIAFRTAPNLNAILVKCSFGNMPCAGTVEFPWMTHLPKGKKVSNNGVFKTSDKLVIPHPSQTWSFHSDGKIILLSEITSSTEAQSIPSGIRWNIHKASEIECLLSIP